MYMVPFLEANPEKVLLTPEIYFYITPKLMYLTLLKPFLGRAPHWGVFPLCNVELFNVGLFNV